MTQKDLEHLQVQGALILPKAVGLTVAGTALIGALSLGWFAADNASRLTHLEVRDREMRERIEERASANARRIDGVEGVKDRVIRLETEVAGMKDILLRIDSKLDRR